MALDVESWSSSEREQRGAVVRIRLLGGVCAETDDGNEIDVGPAKCQALLAALALSAGSAVPVGRLVELVWGDDPPRTAEKTLQTYVGRLRRSLGSEAVLRVGAAYRLDVEPSSVDVLRFQAAIDAGVVAGALQEWTGPPLAGVDAPGLRGTVEGLREQWLGAVEADLTDAVARDPAAAVATLTELTAAHPFRERLWALLMTALYRVGRQADALAAYGRARHHLVEELGVEPGPALQELEASILGHDQRLEHRASPPGPSPPPSGTVTFAFSDIEGSSRLWAEHRSRMARVLAAHDEILRGAVQDHGGYVFSTGGDSFGVAFDRAAAAAAWASTVQHALASASWPEAIAVRVRIGLHTGEADERDGDYFGPAVNTAARVAAAGHGGQIVVSGVTAGLLDRDDLEPLGRHRLDGVPAELELHQVGADPHPPLRTDPSRPGNLPRRTGRLHGRDAELDLVGDAMASAPVVTLVGPGGIGKTRLAVAAATLTEATFPGGAWLVELADVTGPDDVAGAVAAALDATPRDRTDLADAVVALLGDRRALVVLDNCEHVVEGAAALAAAIADQCPEVTVLATSREGLGIPDERIVVVGPLDPQGAAAELFVERACAADPGFRPDGARQAIEEICRRLDGVPLALELAAARLRSLTPADLAARLDDRLRLLTGGRRRSVERHRTLRATIQWSHDLLSEQERRVFRRLSVFAGSFTLEAAEAVVADGQVPADEVHVVLGDLVDRSMVVVESGPYGRRYRLLEVIRQFAADDLDANEGAADLAAGHAAYVCDEVGRLGTLLSGHGEIDGAARLAELWPNLRAAVDWAIAAEDVELAASLIRPIALQTLVRRGTGEIADWVERLLAVIPDDDEDTTAEALLWAAAHYALTQRRGRFRRLIEDSGSPDHLFARYAYLVGVEDDDFGALELGPHVVAEMRRRGDEPKARLFDVFVGGALLNAGRFDEMERKLGSLAQTFREEGPPSFLNWSLFLLGAGALFQGDVETAERHWDEVATIAVPPRTNSPNETLAARTAFRQGRRRDAYDILRRYIDELIEVDNMSGRDMVGIEFVNMMVALGRLEEAAEILGHFDATGLLQVDGPGFWLLIRDAVAAVDDDASAAAARHTAAERRVDELEALASMRDVLSSLLDDG